MKLSVCIFTYNHKLFIAEAIESVLKQITNFDFEIVIGEDCSTDGTREIVKFYQEKYPQKIRTIFNSENLGMMQNNMNTILQSQGDYISLLDGDDYWIYDQKLQRQVDFLEANPKYAMCYHDGKVLVDGVIHDRTLNSHLKKNEITFTDIICDVSIATFSLVFRREALSGYPPPWFKNLNAPDRPLFLLLASHGPCYLIRETWGIYRIHPNGSWSGQNYQSKWLTHLQIFRVINKHYRNVYQESFCRCECKISFILAVELIIDKKFLRAKCYIRKYMRFNRGLLHMSPTAFVKFIVLIFFYFKTRYFNKLLVR
jgi:glycosyltransferase involved in cell wall biosynthesis